MPPKPRQQQPRQKVEKVRYWPGKAPAPERHSDSEDDNEGREAERGAGAGAGGGGGKLLHLSSVSTYSASGPSRTHPPQQDAAAAQSAPPVAAPAAAATDRRMQRLLKQRQGGSRDDHDDEDEEDEGGDGHVPARRHTGHQGHSAGAGADEDGDDEDEDAALARRQRLRAAAMQRAKEDEEAAVTTEDPIGEEVEDESESEYTSDSEDDDISRPVLFKPVFIPKGHRETIEEKNRLAQDAEEAEQRRLQQIEERKLESFSLVTEQLQKELAAASVQDLEGVPDVDDTDGIDEDEEYEAWKLRELMRIKRDREEAEEFEREEEEKERRRNMTDAEIIAENAILKPQAEKKKYNYLQKYFHKGAFYADEKILDRDFNEPTLEDKIDKSVLPAVMQVKKFGFAGRTKWTHLTNEDTSIGDSAWFDKKSEINKRLISKMGGMEQSFQKPSKKQRTQ